MEAGLNDSALAVVAACVVIWGLTSARLERFHITGPIAFVLLGLAVTHPPLSLIHLNLESGAIRSLAELTLALVLFVDASRVNFRSLGADLATPARLLGIGLPLTIGAGTAVAIGLFSGTGAWVAATIAAIVAPTDAALGAPIMKDPAVPKGVRRLLNVESGLNDGIATPFVNLFLAGALGAESLHGAGPGRAAVDLVGGAGIGLGVGFLGAAALLLCRRRQWDIPAFESVSVLGLALFAYGTALVAGCNGFVAAFIAGMAFGSAMPSTGPLTVGYTDETGELLSLLVWFGFGAVMVVPGLQDARWQDLLFAVVALTVVRMVPVAIALIGSGHDRATVAFIGWFGPRGLASVVFCLVAVDSLAPGAGDRVLASVTVTVGLSVLAHGITAEPLAKRYGRFAAALENRAPEHQDAGEIPGRSLPGRGRLARRMPTR